MAFSNYTFLKPLIPYFNHYAFDLDFYYLDKWLHFGFSPWEVTHYLFPGALSSAGPAFFHHFESLDAYAQLMQRLESQSEYLSEQGLLPLWMLSTQDMLWENYIDGVIIKGSGISAMPSLHVTIAVLMAMTAYKLNKKLGYVAWVYTFIIQIDSVHLAWHYAVDGYVGALCVVILWHLIGYLLKRNHQSITQHQ
ncbi:phosphatase PAP2 family protein [Vibrio chagasii]